jgi:hypothetical protein
MNAVIIILVAALAVGGTISGVTNADLALAAGKYVYTPVTSQRAQVKADFTAFSAGDIQWFAFDAVKVGRVVVAHGYSSGNTTAPEEEIAAAALVIACHPQRVGDATGKPVAGDWAFPSQLRYHRNKFWVTPNP